MHTQEWIIHSYQANAEFNTKKKEVLSHKEIHK